MDSKGTPPKYTPYLQHIELTTPEKKLAAKNRADRSKRRLMKVEEISACSKASLKKSPTPPLSSNMIDVDNQNLPPIHHRPPLPLDLIRTTTPRPWIFSKVTPHADSDRKKSPLSLPACQWYNLMLKWRFPPIRNQ